MLLIVNVKSTYRISALQGTFGEEVEVEEAVEEEEDTVSVVEVILVASCSCIALV